MRLAADGRSPRDPGNRCNATAGPRDGAVLRKVVVADVYGKTVEHLQAAFPGRLYVYAYDWRKTPKLALAGLDAIVDRARAEHGGVRARTRPTRWAAS